MSSTRNMAALTRSSVFGSLFQSALEEYEKETGINLNQHPLAVRLDHCDSVESITAALQEQAQAFREFREGNRKIIMLLQNAVQALHKVSGMANLGESVGFVCQKGLCGSCCV